MLYIIRAYEGPVDIFEYEYGLLEHAREHLQQEKAARVELYEYSKGIERLIETKGVKENE